MIAENVYAAWLKARLDPLRVSVERVFVVLRSAQVDDRGRPVRRIVADVSRDIEADLGVPGIVVRPSAEWGA